MKNLFSALRIFAFLTIVTGVAYPLTVSLVSEIVFADKARGSLIERDGKSVGSRLIGQKFESAQYFWPRPSAVDFNPMPTGGSNLGPISADLKKVVGERRAKLRAVHPDQGEPPQELLFASASGVDPHISPEAARYQVARVAEARKFNDVQRARLFQLLKDKTERRQLGILGEPRVNVLELNLALDVL